MGRPRKTTPGRSKRRLSTSDDSEKEEKSTVPKRSKSGKVEKASTFHSIHKFKSEDAKEFTTSLLKWYHSNKRDLPWRSLEEDLSPTDKAYAVLVSEVMLQQTQVVTVLQYYTKWMSRWPTFGHLAQASLNEVNEVWAGMGYYSRAKRLWEAAKKVDGELNNEVPLTSAELQEKLPGVGRYTAGAVASIAFGEKAAAVDGNVIRVLSRVRCIGADHTSKNVLSVYKVVIDHIWSQSEKLVPANEPGNFNQAMMDLGATVCTPKKPSCRTCPVSHLCLAYQRVQHTNPLRELQTEATKPVVEDIENVPCQLCLKQPWDVELGVMNFPQKAKKAPPRKEVTLVCVMHISNPSGKNEYLLVQRPQGGLLAGLWEFPNILFDGDRREDSTEEKHMLEKKLLKEQCGVGKNLHQPCFIAEVPHIFSHIHQLYLVYSLKLSKRSDVSIETQQEIKWMNSDEILSSAISTAMKKVFNSLSSHEKKESSSASKGHPKSKQPVRNVRKVSDFFKKVEK